MPDPLPPLTPAQPPYRVETRDQAFTRTGEIDRLLALTLTPRFNAVGAWELTIPAGSAQAALLGRQTGIVVYAEDVTDPILSGPCRGRKLSWDESNPGEGTWTYYGPTDEIWVAERLAFQVPGQPATNQVAADYDRRAGAAETVVRGYVDVNAGPAAIAARQVAGLTLAADQARGGTVRGSARMQPLLDVIGPLAHSGGIGFRVVDTGAGLQLQVYLPADRTATARFGRELGNLVKLEWVDEAAKATAAVVGGGGEGTARVFRERLNPAAAAAWGHRAELFGDRRDTADVAELDQSGDETLADSGPLVGLAITTRDVPDLAYARDYALGDTVTVEPETGVATADVLREVTIAWTASEGARTTSTVGSAQATGKDSPRLLKTISTLLRRAAQLETRR